VVTAFFLARSATICLEASVLTGLAEIRSCEDARTACRRLLDGGVNAAVVKLGANGVVVMALDKEPVHIPGHKVRAVDTTAAGDAFAAALAVGIADGLDPVESAVFANAAAALSVQRPGAQSSMPSRAEVDAFFQGFASLFDPPLGRAHSMAYHGSITRGARRQFVRETRQAVGRAVSASD
jgi:sugar/nucleoside kinase (ribokinase family)